MKDIIFIKWGGSLITDKDKPFTPNLDTIRTLANQIKKLIGVSLYPYGTSGGGYYQSSDMGQTFTEMNSNFQDYIPAATIKRRTDSRKAPFSLYMGLFEGGDGGAKIYHMQQDISGLENQQ